MSNMEAVQPAEKKLTSEEIQAFRKFLKSTVLTFHEVDNEESVDKFLSTAEEESKLKTFLSESEQQLLIFTTIEHESDASNPDFRLTINLKNLKLHGQGLAVLKKKANLGLGETKVRMNRLFHVLNLGDMETEFNPYSLTHSCINSLFLPFFNHIKGFEEGDSSVSSKVTTDKRIITSIQKKLSDLDITLIQNNKEIEIQDISLEIDDRVAEYAAKFKEEGKEPNLDDFPAELLEDESFVGNLVQNVEKWYNLLTMLFENEKKYTSDSIIDEIKYYSAYLKSLEKVEMEVASPEAQVIQLIFNAKRKFRNSNFLKVDTFKTQLSNVKAIDAFMKEIPIVKLLSSNDLTDVANSIVSIMDHFKNLVNVRAYTNEKIQNLIKCLSNDLNKKLRSILKEAEILDMDREEFDDLHKNFKIVFVKWEFKMKSMSEEFRKQRADRTSIKQTIDVHASDLTLKERVDEVRRIREAHQNLKEIFIDIQTKEKFDADNTDLSTFMNFSDIDSSFNHFRKIDIIDCSKEGTAAFNTALSNYESEIGIVERTIISKIRELLGAATNSSEMFRVFRKFSSLLKRPQVKSAIYEYQDSLVKSFRGDLNDLKDKLGNGYESSGSNMIAQFYDIPDLTGSCIWSKEINRKLENNIENITSVMGEEWFRTKQGREIKEYEEFFKSKIKFGIKRIEEFRDSSNTDKIERRTLFIVRERMGHSELELVINFDESSMNSVKELRNLLKLPFDVFIRFTIQYNFWKKTWPIFLKASSLNESVLQYNYVSRKIDSNSEKLLANKLNELQGLIKKGLTHTWADHKKVDTYIRSFGEKVNVLEETAGFILEKNEVIKSTIDTIKTCELDADIFRQKIEDLQSILNDFNFKRYSNLHIWVKDLETSVEDVLKTRLENLIEQWISEFENYKKRDKDRLLIRENTIHEIKVQNQALFVEPSIEHATAFWLNHFHSCLGVITNLKKLDPNAYSGWNQAVIKEEQNYSSLLATLDSKIIYNAYSRIDNTLKDAKKYVNTWLNFQALWEISSEEIYAKLGTDIKIWQKVLNDIKTGRNTFDNSETEKFFGAIRVNYRTVQNKINNKYDSWHKEILGQFGKTLNESIQDFSTVLEEARKKLERINFTNSEDIVVAVSDLQFSKRNKRTWSDQLAHFKEGQKLLQRQKFHFPDDWMYVDQLEGRWIMFEQLLTQKSADFDKLAEELRSKLEAEEQIINDKVKVIENIWEEKKPFKGALKPKVALDILSNIQDQLKKIIESFENLNKAKELMNLSHVDTSRVDSRVEEANDYKEVWVEIAKVWADVDAMHETTLTSAQPIRMIKRLDAVVQAMNEFPNKLRNFEPFVAKKDELKRLQKTTKMINELKTEAFKERHWEEMLKKINLNKRLSDLTVGVLWDYDILRFENPINEIISQATGEFVLEDMIKKIKTYWQNYQLELVRFQNRCKLIREWDDLFNKLDEDLGSLASMKLSPHYKSFEEEIKPWNERLQFVRIIFDIWIDVQKKWVYLEGIFFGSGEIKMQLPNDYNRFKGIDNEFTSLMKKVSAKPKILDVISLEQLQKTLERLVESLDKIQKALTDYLETQRQAFSRFYFVGDEDLLEIIGNSKDVINIQKHFPKMFAGITYIANEDKGNLLKGMQSKEGEVVEFIESFKISDNNRIDAWLKLVEQQMKISLANDLKHCIKKIASIDDISTLQKFAPYKQAIVDHSSQASMLSSQIDWTERSEGCLDQNKLVTEVAERIVTILSNFAEEVLGDIPKDIRKKYEQLITECVHQRDVSRILVEKNVSSPKEFSWQYYMRFYYNPNEKDILKQLVIRMGNAMFNYSYEYLGVAEKLVQTPLTDKCYLTLTQALSLRMGGAPFGPAGTGKTESVKMLGSTLGNFVLVFNCDENFNFKAMGRIFIGLCQVGAWGCFDEFNRLEERILSAVSQQILTIQTGMRDKISKIELMGREVKLSTTMGIFITMNPGYAGRSNLPENLKQLFRQMAMVTPDRELIGQVMLFSQGFKSAERIAGKIVSLFELCHDQLSSQPHYDFGLRSLKAVLNSAGALKRDRNTGEVQDMITFEQDILLRSLCDTVVPKLVAEDIPLLSNLVSGVFPGTEIPKIEDPSLYNALLIECKRRFVEPTENFIEKCLQLNQIMKLTHGVMVVGPSGCGKSAAWHVLLDSLTRVDGVKGDYYIIDPKAISKDDLYGRLDNTTLDWNDGIFTHILRKIVENQRGESQRRHWIVFDGDVDPEWAENLNSVLDDNKLLTLPNGERIAIPPNVALLFEVESLKYATLATVSRCGMVWFSEEIITTLNIFYHYMERLKQEDYDELTMEMEEGTENQVIKGDPAAIAIRNKCVEYIKPLLNSDSCFGIRAVELVENREHAMDFSRIRVLEAAFALCRKGISNIVEYNENSEFPLDEEVMRNYIIKWCIIGFNWGLAGDLKLGDRDRFWKDLSQSVTFDVEMPPIGENLTLIDYEVKLEDGSWNLWKNKVPYLDLEPERVTDADLIITTVDTLRHQEILCSWLSEHRPFLLCGPPGSGKTMTLMSTLKGLPDFEMIFINFSSSTTPELIQKQFDHYCEYTKTHKGIFLHPKQPNKWLVVFCDEINLPDEDKYGTQAVITFLRQLTEQRGFWRTSDKTWISLERIQFVGACNPPTDVGRHPLSLRFLRHAPLILVDFPGYDSLTQIYGTFNRAMLKKVPVLKGMGDQLTKAMVDYYTKSQRRFTSDMQPHYIYSPRELTRWKYAVNEAMETFESAEDLARLWAHEALRLFEDRLVYDEEKKWCQEQVDAIGAECFPNVNSTSFDRPILFSSYLTKSYKSVEREALREFVTAKLKTFNEEEYDVQLVVFDSVLDHIIRIDRVLKQPIGHCLLVGASGVGKTTLSRFVSWMNNLTVFQIKAGRAYGLTDFDNDLRSVMKRAGCKSEKITFIFDESNVLGVAFLERMNALLASGEVPGLFEGDEYNALISACKEGFGGGKMMETEEEIYRKFIKNVQRNLHVVFTMNPSSPDFSNRAGSSPAIFNRCVIDWFGEWSDEALYQVAKELTEKVDYPEESFGSKMGREEIHGKMTELIVYVHNSVRELNKKLQKSAKKFNYITPRDYLDFIRHFVVLQREKKSELEEQQLHINSGLSKLRETEEQVIEMKASLTVYKKELQQKDLEAKEKLKCMVEEQRNAEKKKESSIKLNEELVKKQAEISKRSAVIEKDLAEAEPALKAAESAVDSINTKDLDNLRKLPNPPKKVKLVMEAICLMLTKKVLSWKEIGGIMRQKTFTKDVKDFDVDKIDKKLKKQLIDEYIKSNEWDIDSIRKAYSCAGDLACWLDAKLKFAEIVLSLGPLRSELKGLTDEAEVMKKEKDEVEILIDELQKKIATLEQEYSALVVNVEGIRSEKEQVEKKVIRSENLLTNLSSEKIRWDQTSKGFAEQMKTMTGDTLIAAAFLGYIGFFDQFYRTILMDHWRDVFEEKGLIFRNDLSIVEFLSKPSDRMHWQSHSLPNDNLCTENAIILSRFNRYPLIIDPSGQAMEFLLSYYKDKTIARTSFADEAFMKQLETSLRFGCPILVQDVEKIDPILNSVLNKEIIKQGGRVLIRVGDHEIDFSESFKLFMVTRDSEARFTPDLCSRVTFVNFTVTPASLQNQCLNIYLKSERPDIEQKRIKLLKLQGEFIVKLRGFEDDLLEKLSNVQGSILDDEDAIQTLESLKKEAEIVTNEMKESGKVLAEVESVTEQYVELASNSASIYFSMQNMGGIYSFYQFSLRFYMNIVNRVLTSNEALKAIPTEEHKKRIEVIRHQLFVQSYHKVYYALLNKDKLPFALKLAQINTGVQLDEYFKLLLRPTTLIQTSLSPSMLCHKLKDNQLKTLEEISKKRGFEHLIDHINQNESKWIQFFESENVEDVPEGWIDDGSLGTIPDANRANSRELMNIIVSNILKPDQTISRLQHFLEKALGGDFYNVAQLDLKVSMGDSDAKSPLLLSSAPGFDASFKVDQLAKELGVKYTAVALGSAEGFEIAEKAIDKALQSGSWVLLKNVHLATDWLNEVEQKIFRAIPHQNFRLFMTMEFSEKIPNTLLRESMKFIFELPDGVKASISRTFGSVIVPARSDTDPVERSRLHFLLGWLHSVILERMRYHPIGWSKKYEFNEADLRCAMDLVDEYIDLQGQRHNLPIDKIPWDAIRSVLINNIYGGKIDNEYDALILKSLVEQYFSVKSFDINSSMVPELTDEGLKIPEATTTSQFASWIKSLPANESPVWSGLPHNAEKVLKEKKAIYTTSTLWRIQDINNEEITDISPSDGKEEEGSQGQVKWLTELGDRVQNYLEILPVSIQQLHRSKSSLLDPLFRFLEREVSTAGKLLDLSRKNLNDLRKMCAGEIQPLQELKRLATTIYASEIPKAWQRYIIPPNTSTAIFVSDFKKRLDQFAKFVVNKEWQKKGVWLGGLIFPEAFMTATRQAVAQQQSASLDELELRMEIWDEQPVGDESFLLKDLTLEGAEWEGETLMVSSQLSNQLKTIKCTWFKAEAAVRGKAQEGEIMVPVYLNQTRQNLLFSVKLKSGSIERNFLYKRGIALIGWRED